VGTKISFDPIEAAAIIWTAQPQSMDATEAMLPTVFASEINGQLGTVDQRPDEHPTIQQRSLRQRSELRVQVQK
jgi:hypothetical protein